MRRGTWMLDRSAGAVAARCSAAAVRPFVRSSRLLIIIIGQLLAIDPCFGAADGGAAQSEHYHASNDPLTHRHHRCF